jgi:hypothetical protein
MVQTDAGGPSDVSTVFVVPYGYVCALRVRLIWSRYVGHAWFVRGDRSGLLCEWMLGWSRARLYLKPFKCFQNPTKSELSR